MIAFPLPNPTVRALFTEVATMFVTVYDAIRLIVIGVILHTPAVTFPIDCLATYLPSEYIIGSSETAEETSCAV